MNNVDNPNNEQVKKEESKTSLPKRMERWFDLYPLTDQMRDDLEGAIDQDYVFAAGRGLLKGIPIPAKFTPKAKLMSAVFAVGSALEEFAKFRFDVVVSETKNLHKKIGMGTGEANEKLINEKGLLRHDLCWIGSLPKSPREGIEEALSIATENHDYLSHVVEDVRPLMAATCAFPMLRDLCRQFYELFEFLRANLYPNSGNERTKEGCYD